MNGAQSLVATLVAEGVDTCFANPGTSEMHFLAALDNPAMKSVLCLFEGVATGAADGYFRMRRSPAATLLHLGPGLANGLANLHNAKKAASGIVNIVGEHATRHLAYDPPLKSDVEGLARPLSHWVRRADSARTLGHDAAQASLAARQGKIATLILPGEASWGDVGGSAPLPGDGAMPARPVPPAEQIAHCARIIREAAKQGGAPVLLICGGEAARGGGALAAARIAAATGIRIATQFFTPRLERGAGSTPFERIPYFVPAALPFLAEFRHIITVETGEPIAFFAYPDSPSRLKHPDCTVHALAAPGEDGSAALAALVDALGASGQAPNLQPRVETAVPTGKLEPTTIAHALAAALPEGCILVDESLTTGRTSMALTAGAAPHTTLQNMGGSIGFSPPVSTGAALACRERRTFCIVGDGSAMYTIQALWTQAREALPVTTIVFANRAYQILHNEYAAMDIGAPGPRARDMMDIGNPAIDWLAMGKSMGVPGRRVETAEDFYRVMLAFAAEPGPNLIEVAMV